MLAERSNNITIVAGRASTECSTLEEPTFASALFFPSSDSPPPAKRPPCLAALRSSVLASHSDAAAITISMSSSPSEPEVFFFFYMHFCMYIIVPFATFFLFRRVIFFLIPEKISLSISDYFFLSRCNDVYLL